jgi:hypothetical protein
MQAVVAVTKGDHRNGDQEHRGDRGDHQQLQSTSAAVLRFGRVAAFGRFG